MKRYLIIILVYSVLTFSCYQAPESSTGTVSIKLTTAAKGAPAGFDGIFKVAVYSGNIDSYFEKTSEITYLKDFPSPLLANSYIPFNGDSGDLSLMNVPVSSALTLLIERYSTRSDKGSIYFHSYSGISDVFEVDGIDSTEVVIPLIPTGYAGGMSVPKHSSYSASHFRLYDPAYLLGLVTISGNEIPTINYSSQSFNNYGTTGTVSGNVATVSFDVADAILPGRKTRALVSENQTIGQNDYIGITDEFELRPGLSDTVPVTYYQYTNSSSWNYS